MGLTDCFYGNDKNVGNASARLDAAKFRAQSADGLRLRRRLRSAAIAIAIAAAAGKKIMNLRAPASPGNSKSKQSADMGSILYRGAQIFVPNSRSGSETTR